MEKQPFTTLSNTRIDLRPHQCGVAYAQKIYDIIANNRERFKDFMPLIYFLKDAQEEQSFLESCVQKWTSGEEANYAIYIKDTETIIGCIGVFDIDFKKNTCETGYWIAKEYEGKGYIQEAVKTIENDFFKRGISRIEITTDPRNYRSQNTALKSGYTYIGTKEKASEKEIAEGYKELKVFTKIRADWENQR